MCIAVLGFSIFDTSGSVSPKPFINCMKWVSKETIRKHNILEDYDLLPPCPCSGFQAMFSSSHVWLPDTDCFVTVERKFNNANSNRMGMVRNIFELCNASKTCEQNTFVYNCVFHALNVLD